MSYAGEFRTHWRPLAAATLGVALGAALNHYTSSLFGPRLIAEFKWAKADYALVGSLPLLTLFFLPFAGRFIDKFGARIAAIVGFTAVPLTFVAYSMMSGGLLEFFAITIAQYTLGVFTATMVFCRVVVERFDRARGFALSLVMTGAPLAGAVFAPFLGDIIDTEGWRAGYRALAMISATAGGAVVLLMGASKQSSKGAAPQDPPQKNKLTWKEFTALARNPAFALLIGGMFFCNVPQILAQSQLKLMLLDNGAAGKAATWMVSLYAIGVIIGRFASGLALDRIPAHVVAIFTLGLPAIGFLAFASPLDAVWILCGAVLLMGLAQGAEGDIGAFLISRQFDMQHYSFLFALMTASMGAASAIGALTLSFTLRATDSYAPFLLIAAAATVLGAILFYLTNRHRAPEPLAAEPA